MGKTDCLKTVPEGLQGERGLLAAVIARAVKDARGCNHEYRDSAWRYLASDWYGTHLDYLDLPAEWLPAELEPTGALDYKEIIHERL